MNAPRWASPRLRVLYWRVDGPIPSLEWPCASGEAQPLVPGANYVGGPAYLIVAGYSLSGTRVITRLAEQLSLDVQPTLLFTAPTVRTLAERLDQLLDETLAQLEAST